MHSAFAWRGWRLLAEIFQRNLNSVIVHLLILGPEFLAPVRGTMEELDHHPDRGLPWPLDPRRAADVDHAVEIEVVDVVIELVHLYTAGGLIADAQHLRTRTNGGYVLVAPPAILMPQACN